MISYRLRGLIQMHVVATTCTITGYFLLIAAGVHYIPGLDLNADVNLIVYSSPIFLGMLLGGRFWSPVGARFHQLEWADALGVASRQILLVALLIFGLIVATKDRSVSRLFLAFYLVTSWVLLVGLNRVLPAFFSRIAFNRAHQLPALFVGPPKALGRLGEWVRQKEHLGISIVGLLCDEPLESGAWPLPRLGGVADLARVIEERSIGQVILLELPRQSAETLAVVEVCQAAGCRLLVYENISDRLPIPMAPVVEQELIFLTVLDEPLEDPFNRGIKRFYDLLISLPVVALILPPLFALVWLVQRFQAPGPLLFVRRRGGQRRDEFAMLKFRSMYAAAPDADSEAHQACPGDARIFPFGAFLRRTSLDEFPQFWNVLMGDMSVVGPRPHLPLHDAEFAQVAKTYRTRQLVKPGITGLAQIKGFRGEISDPELLRSRVKLDIEYITGWTIWLDLQITAKTAWQMVFPPKSAR